MLVNKYKYDWPFRISRIIATQDQEKGKHKMINEARRRQKTENNSRPPGPPSVVSMGRVVNSAQPYQPSPAMPKLMPKETSYFSPHLGPTLPSISPPEMIGSPRFENQSTPRPMKPQTQFAPAQASPLRHYDQGASSGIEMQPVQRPAQMSANRPSMSRPGTSNMSTSYGQFTDNYGGPKVHAYGTPLRRPEPTLPNVALNDISAPPHTMSPMQSYELPPNEWSGSPGGSVSSSGSSFTTSPKYSTQSHL